MYIETKYIKSALLYASKKQSGYRTDGVHIKVDSGNVSITAINNASLFKVNYKTEDSTEIDVILNASDLKKTMSIIKDDRVSLEIEDGKCKLSSAGANINVGILDGSFPFIPGDCILGGNDNTVSLNSEQLDKLYKVSKLTDTEGNNRVNINTHVKGIKATFSDGNISVVIGGLIKD